MLQPFNPQPLQEVPEDAPVQKPSRDKPPGKGGRDDQTPVPEDGVSPTVVAPG